MKLLEAYEELFSQIQPYFCRIETFQRARDLSYAHLVTYGRRTISRMICSKNEQQADWSADYKFFSKRKWNANDIFFEILRECDTHSHWYQNAVVVAMDESFRKKTGKKIGAVSTLRDPMSLPYHTNLTPAIRFLQASAIINPDNRIDVSRAIPIYFKEAAPAKKPRKNAPEAVKEQYKKEQKERRISVIAHDALLKLREQIDKLPDGVNRPLIITVDGGFCNRNFLRDLPDNIIVIARTRKDIKIFRPVEESKSTPRGGRYRIYGDRLPTPDEIRRDDRYPWKTESVFAAGKYHDLRYKVVSPVLWQKGTGPKRCRLFIIAPLRYRKSKSSRLLYRNPAYLLVPNQDVPEKYILQYYMLRWDIEVNHRDEKSQMGLGDAQVRSPESVGRNPQFTAAVYSLLLLASIRAYGPVRTEDYLPVPKWRKRKEQKDRRPSTLDVIAQFRREIMVAQLERDFDQKKKTTKKKRRRKKSSSLTEARKRGFINDKNMDTKPPKLPVNILAALLYADS